MTALLEKLRAILAVPTRDRESWVDVFGRIVAISDHIETANRHKPVLSEHCT